MMRSTRTRTARGRAVAAAATVVAIALSGGCGLQDVKIPNFDGPATTGISFVITATPDAVKADGLSSAVVVATLRGPDGAGIAGREIVFFVRDSEGRAAAIGKLSADRVTTGTDGRARTIFTAPARAEFDTRSSVFVEGRLVGDDLSGYDWSMRTVGIEVLPVDTRRYPPNASPTGPVCGFVLEPRFGYYYVGVPIRFQSTSYDPDGYITGTSGASLTARRPSRRTCTTPTTRKGRTTQRTP